MYCAYASSSNRVMMEYVTPGLWTKSTIVVATCEVEYEFVFKDRLSEVTESIGNATNGPRLSWMGTNEREKLADRRKQTANIDEIYELTDKKKH